MRRHNGLFHPPAFGRELGSVLDRRGDKFAGWDFAFGHRALITLAGFFVYGNSAESGD